MAASPPGSRAARRRSTCASRSCAGSRTASRSSTRSSTSGRSARSPRPARSSSRAMPRRRRSRPPITINQDILRAVGLVRTLNKPMKILGAGEISTPLFVVADAFTASARAKIEAAGGSVNVLEVPKTPLAALGVTPEAEAAPVADEAVADKPAKAPKAAKPKAEAAKPKAEAAASRRGRGRAPRPTPAPARPRPRTPRLPRRTPPTPMPTSRPWPTRPSRRPATTPDPCSNRS